MTRLSGRPIIPHANQGKGAHFLPMSERRVLESWKAIVDYLGHDVKTCRRWTKDLGLPVHRLDESAKARVFAYTDELDRWKQEKLEHHAVHLARTRTKTVWKARIWVISTAVLVVLAVVSGLLIWRSRLADKTAGLQTVKSVAVLPFVDLSPDKSQEHIGDGIADILINSLNRAGGLRIPSRTSAFYFKGKNVTPTEIGSRLKVDWILEGSVQVDKNRLRVVASLLRAADGTTIWADRYDKDQFDIFTVEDEIALSVVKALQVKLPPKAGVQLIDRGTESPEAHELFLRAQHYSTKGFVFYEKAIECFEQAIEKDPNFARAHSGLAGCTFGLGCNGLTEPEKAYPKAKTAALKALEIDPSDSHALRILASIKMVYEWDFPGAEQDIRKALRMDPAVPRLHLMYADLLSALGRHEEALEEAKQASVSALPHPSTVNGQAMFTLYRARKYNLAVEMLKKNLEFDPFYVATYGNLTAVYLAMGRYQEARETHDRSHEIRGVIEKQDEDDATSAIIYAGTGQAAEARRILAGIKAKMKTSYVMPIVVAEIHAALGDRDEAFAWLEKAYRERCAYLYGIKCDAWFDSLRDDPRFTDLLRRIGLEK